MNKTITKIMTGVTLGSMVFAVPVIAAEPAPEDAAIIEAVEEAAVDAAAEDAGLEEITIEDAVTEEDATDATDAVMSEEDTEDAIEEVAMDEDLVEEDLFETLDIKDGAAAIVIPKADEESEKTWAVVDDQQVLFKLSDGKNEISVEHFGIDEQMPSFAKPDDTYKEIYQTFYATDNEVFILTGKITDKEDTDVVKAIVNSFEVMDAAAFHVEPATQPEAETQPQQTGFSVRQFSETRYCIEPRGVNVRSGYSTNDSIIGGYDYGDQVTVTGAVTKDGADYGWLQVNYNNQTGYVYGSHFGTTRPAVTTTPTQPTATQTQPTATPVPTENDLVSDGQIFTGITMTLYEPVTGTPVLVKELTQGDWANEETGVVYTQEAGGGDHFFGSDGSELVTEYYYVNTVTQTGDLISDGQIFTGNTMELWDPAGGGNIINVQELTDGRWADVETGNTFVQDSMDSRVYHDDNGGTWVTEAYMSELYSE